MADLVGGRANPRQGSYHREDCLRWAAKHGIEMRFLAREEVPARGDEAGCLLDAALADFDRIECPGGPTFVFEGERFWGKDRVDWLADAVRRRLAS